MNKNISINKRTGKTRALGTSPNEIHRTWSERWKIVKEYYASTTNARKSMSRGQKNKWRQWLMKEATKADKSQNKHYRSTDALKKRIKAKWWAVNHRYSDNKNKRRNAVKRFVLKQASYQDLYRINKWIDKRKNTLVAKGKKTRQARQVRNKALKSKEKQAKNYLP